MQSFIVMQGQTYQEEKELGMIWSRKQDNGGNLQHSWLRVKDVNEWGSHISLCKREYCSD